MLASSQTSQRAADVGHIVLVVGPPCAGKTTLAAALAEVLDAEHVSMGELIRSERAAGRMPADAQRAFLAAGDYPVDWLAQLLGKRLDARTRDVTIIETGGAPIAEVTAPLADDLRCALILTAPEDVCARRFESRSSTNGRSDDSSAIFHARTQRLAAGAQALRESLAVRCPTLEIQAGDSAQTTLRSALQALLAGTVARARARVPVVETSLPPHSLMRGGSLQRSWQAHDTVSITHDSGDGSIPLNHLLLLLKPGVAVTPLVERVLIERLAHFGCEVRAAAVWSRGSGMLEHLARAHLGTHCVMALGGALVLDEGQRARAQEACDGLPIFGGYEFERRFGARTLSEVWKDQSPVPAVRRVEPNLWVGHCEEPECVIINGHIPAIVRSYGDADAVMALHITAPESTPLPRLRHDLLGTTDPALAARDSLRGLAATGRLELGWQATHRNNAFHLSEDALEGARELALWFGTDTPGARDVKFH